MSYIERVDHNKDEQHEVEVELPVEIPGTVEEWTRDRGTLSTNSTGNLLVLSLQRHHLPQVHDSYDLKYDELKHGAGESESDGEQQLNNHVSNLQRTREKDDQINVYNAL